MKKLFFTACMILTLTSVFASNVGENATDCGEMIQSSRNTNPDVADAQVEGNPEVTQDAEAQ